MGGGEEGKGEEPQERGEEGPEGRAQLLTRPEQAPDCAPNRDPRSVSRCKGDG